jgi:hypothetical protein
MVEKPVSNYSVEFYSPDNLFIPFPAVMVNHKNKQFLNQVHSFNRVLNDIFENDDINTHQVKESSVDLILNKSTDTCLLFTAGPLGCKGALDIEIYSDHNIYKKSQQLDVPRFGTKKISIKDTFNTLPDGMKGVLKASQPSQLLFYGRLLSGQWTNDGIFSANHTYYDSSTVEEYWDDDRPSKRCYPFFKKLSNIVRIYPIQSPSTLDVSVIPRDKDGKQIKELHIGKVQSPSGSYLDFNINDLIEQDKIEPERVSSFEIVAKADPGKMPTRIGHQLVYGGGGLESSINVVLNNPNKFVPENAKSFKWGQTVIGEEFDTFVGIVADCSQNPNIEYQTAKVTFYDSNGKLAERNWNIPNGSSVTFELGDELRSEISNYDKNSLEYIWCTVESEKHGLDFCSVAYNKISRHCSGDHGF